MRIFAAAALAVSLAVPASAQAPCGPDQAVRDVLSDRHGESVIKSEVAGDNVLLELWANPETGTWTLTGTRDGLMCILRSGERVEGVAL